MKNEIEIRAANDIEMAERDEIVERISDAIKGKNNGCVLTALALCLIGHAIHTKISFSNIHFLIDKLWLQIEESKQ